ncbi:NAD-dependent epimerase/dehydratase family protein [Rhodococcus spongiicola]|uniref:NAD-dependent epimerase/dehydratase family protein n=1 Tax=Rhodococcus spongiicola TaxID=2487352 RepID=A0A3S3A8X6_9NOCA|nr:NAD-dependent epimerase/dehydratase family protein [Rhodococcus spongiicola]RVW02361.1 NAD-dependent epimerase/dehydratase family protein [Rhodococcus spongiicola]
MSNLQVVTGAGPVGWTVAEQLADAGHDVLVLTRSGSGPVHPRIERRKVDVSDPTALGPALDGAAAVFHCIHGSEYDARAWERELPVAERVVMDAAQRIGAVVVFPESLYAYGRPDGPMTEDNPRDATAGKLGVRARLLAARAAHRVPTVSVVAADFFGPRVRDAHAGERMVPAVLNGKTIRVMGRPDVVHSFTYVPDLAKAMIAAAQDQRLWNTVLHAPTAPAVTQRQMVEAFASAAHVRAPKVGTLPSMLLRAIGSVHRPTRELAEMLYQFEAPYVMDSSRSEQLLGLAPTPLDEAAVQTVRWWENDLAATTAR